MTRQLQALIDLAASMHGEGHPWPDVAKLLLDRGVTPADMARALLSQGLEWGAQLATFRAAVLLPPDSADFMSVRWVFEEHGFDLEECVDHMVSHSGNRGAYRQKAARRLGLSLG
ncbi:MAG: hypothetical protein H6Q00_911 [Holophagaceae bacterium]|nr:hypothetical protein [Holophagaceae bacterium]